MQVHVTARFVRNAPRKVRLVGDSLKGLPIEFALAKVKILHQAAAKPIFNALHAAFTIAKEREMDPADTKVAVIRVDQGPVLKRRVIQSRGRSSPIRKQYSHITVQLRDTKTENAPKAKKTAPETAAPKEEA